MNPKDLEQIKACIAVADDEYGLGDGAITELVDKLEADARALEAIRQVIGADVLAVLAERPETYVFARGLNVTERALLRGALGQEWKIEIHDPEARALWAVRVLDAHARKEQLDSPYVPEWVGDQYKLDVEDRHGPEWLFFAPTPDAARIAAATALVAADPTLDPDHQ